MNRSKLRAWVNERRRLAVALLLCASGVVVQSLAGHTTRPGSGGLTAPAQRVGVHEFDLVQTDGAPWRLEDHRGHIVLINLWATWCGPCLEEAPELSRAARELGPAADWVGLSLDAGGATGQNRTRVQGYARHFAVGYPLAFPRSGSTLSFTDTPIPTTLLIDRDGRLAKTYTGPVTASVLETDVRQLLRET